MTRDYVQPIWDGERWRKCTLGVPCWIGVLTLNFGQFDSRLGRHCAGACSRRTVRECFRVVIGCATNCTEILVHDAASGTIWLDAMQVQAGRTKSSRPDAWHVLSRRGPFPRDMILPHSYFSLQNPTIRVHVLLAALVAK